MTDTQTNAPMLKIVVFTCLEVPRLSGVSTSKCIESSHPRELYENELKDENEHAVTQITATSYKPSMDDFDLAPFLAEEWIKTRSIKDIIELQILQCASDR